MGPRNPKFSNVDADQVATDEDGNEVLAEDQVWFSGSSPVMELVTQFPEISEDGRSVTLTFDSVRSDWLMDMQFPPVAAHAVAGIALDIADAQEAKDALVAAFRDNDSAALNKIAGVWNTGFNFTSMPSDPRVHLSTGPFILDEFVENQHLTLVRNEAFDWGNVPAVDQVTFRFTEDPMAAITALQNGEVDIISPQSSVDVLKTLAGLDGIEYETGVEATWEHVTLMHNYGGPFDAATYGGNVDVARLVRQAFLQTIPRQQIIDTLITPLQDDAAIRNSFNFVPGAPATTRPWPATGLTSSSVTPRRRPSCSSRRVRCTPGCPRRSTCASSSVPRTSAAPTSSSSSRLRPRRSASTSSTAATTTGARSSSPATVRSTPRSSGGSPPARCC
ncbi:ABC transporter substrate-binding protein [Xylanimonas protaetiae]|uniref:Solute-binding protein family 5 domain-containing protein n=1 Tax=Xylanimonas protaetiae TaxID=2509457 RepID=A0A4P6F437_9MICO|nr:ABC transporter substrate-binding protein [Xylanimonas protaetiae]QAY70314.1 hypothetical protein ET471_09940 [Xylanimonas protaetiae]